MVPDEEEEECEALVGLIPESGNRLSIPEDSRNRKMSRKVSYANIANFVPHK